MKKNLRFSFLLFALLGFGLANAQVCVVDPQYASPGIYPSDTLQDMRVGDPTLQVIQFVFPVDTVIFGFTLPFDSFIVSSVSNIPPGVQWECNLNHPTCVYVSNPPNLTRGCVKVFGTPTSGSTGFSAYDSLIVTGVAYVTVLGNVTPISQDISVFYRVDPNVGINDGIKNSLKLGVNPNPSHNNAWVSFNLETPSDVKLSVYNTLGDEVAVMNDGLMTAGEKNLALTTSELGDGIYFLRLSLNNGEYVETQKIVNLR